MTRVTTGLNDYRYVASLHVQHPSIDADTITRSIPFKPDRVCKLGDPKRTPNGKPLSGHYDQTHWHVKLETPADGDVTDFLRLLCERLSRCREFLGQLDDSGGRAEIFIGLFADRCCDFELPSSLLADLASAGLSLRLDYYGPDQPPPEA